MTILKLEICWDKGKEKAWIKRECFKENKLTDSEML